MFSSSAHTHLTRHDLRDNHVIKQKNYFTCVPCCEMSRILCTTPKPTNFLATETLKCKSSYILGQPFFFAISKVILEHIDLK